MTNKDYSTLQRHIGLIEGVVSHSENYVYEIVTESLKAIEEIIEKEVGDTDDR